MQVETAESLIITLPLHAEYTGIISEIAHWFMNGNDKQVEALTVSLRHVTDTLACVMPDTSACQATNQDIDKPPY